MERGADNRVEGSGADRNARGADFNKRKGIIMTRTYRNALGAAAAALALAFAAVAGWAQPGHHRGPAGGRRSAIIGPGDCKARKAQLNLNTSQQQMFDEQRRAIEGGLRGGPHACRA